LLFLSLLHFSVTTLGNACPSCGNRTGWQRPKLDNDDFPRE
jgi:hypothetical protein